ncbi:MAG: hypothetical protein ABIH20_03920 [Candidatus Diapherotrites archaeon]
MSQTRTIGLVVIAVIILAGAYFFLGFDGSDFEEAREEINEVWVAEGINIEKIDFDTSEQLSLTNNELAEMKIKINRIKSKYSSSDDSEAISAFVEVHLSSVQIIENINLFVEASYDFDIDTTDGESLCVVSLSSFDDLTSLGDSTVSNIKNHNEKITSFSRNYSKDYSISVSNLFIEQESFEVSLKNLKSTRKNIEELCE